MLKNILELPFLAASRFPDRISHKYRIGKNTETRRYSDFCLSIRELTAAFQESGITRGDHIGFFVNNRYEWSVTDYALQALGAVSVPRGSDTTAREVQFIYSPSDSVILILENTQQLIDLQTDFAAADWEKCRKILPDFLSRGTEPVQICPARAERSVDQ